MAGAGGNGIGQPPEAFRGIAARLASGVSIVAALVGGEPFATTAGSVVTASWEPPLLAVFFRAGSRMASAIHQSGCFAVNVLGEADHGLARRFARPDRSQGWDAFPAIALLRREPTPVLSGAVAWADCAVAQTVSIGDHICYAGLVLDSGRNDALAPLTYYRGRYRGLGPAVAPASWEELDATNLAAVW